MLELVALIFVTALAYPFLVNLKFYRKMIGGYWIKPCESLLWLKVSKETYIRHMTYEWFLCEFEEYRK